jgi:drug/metabolite transporter (DMT)-like permease
LVGRAIVLSSNANAPVEARAYYRTNAAGAMIIGCAGWARSSSSKSVSRVEYARMRKAAENGNFAGVWAALGAALLFGLSTPFSKILLGGMPPFMLAGLLYLGAGIGLGALHLGNHGKREAKLPLSGIPWLAGAVLAGGIIGPVLLLYGLLHTPASSASLLLNLECVFTVLLARLIFRENLDWRIAAGMALIVAGGAALSWEGGGLAVSLPALAIAGACLAWGIDNNLTQRVSASDPAQIAAIKGIVAGVVNVTLAFILGAQIPALPSIGWAMLVGFLGYGLSLALFVYALRNIGAARTGAYFSLAPFAGASAC